MSDHKPAPSRDLGELLAIMAALRAPGTGCPWDLEQSFETIAPYTIEEAYEVADAIQRHDLGDLCDELGDLLLQVVFHARMAEEQRAFDFGDVVWAITSKLIRRHPHVFGDVRDLSPNEVKALWSRIKAEERQDRAARGGEPSPEGVLDGVALGLPALTRADKLTRKAAAVGFTWAETSSVIDKIDEELAEVREAVAKGDHAHATEEIGDLLFTVANLARHLEVDPEAALRAANAKFERRFRSIERALAESGRSPTDSDLAEMDRLWDAAKAAEKTGA
ncbi:MAG TPA: nucleoside triphosphate pyrophosphohydrolase [Enterovirga sp.]|nr:nucleoside triphosphate pyrophosphohydrolase [Enterovirga sp.]